MNWNNVIRPPAPHRLYWAITMGLFTILMAWLTVEMILRGRYWVAAWDFMCVVIDAVACLASTMIYLDWKKKLKKPV